jgi:CRISPR/Cas system CSM-associated protein Csm2 small subunit
MVTVPQIPGITGQARNLFVRLYRQIIKSNPQASRNPNTVARVVIQQMATNYGYRIVRNANGVTEFKKVTPQMMKKMQLQQNTRQKVSNQFGMGIGLPRSAGY